ncbi:hypothetical protein Tco_0192175, partial [Tanacetum coccineum]
LTRRACYKEPHEITKVVRRANETLPAFKERWTVETGLIMGVPEVMKISSFMDSIKSPELANKNGLGGFRRRGGETIGENRSGRLKALHAIPSTIHSMIRFPTPKGIATLVTRATIIAECRLREGKQILTEKQPEIHET